jgi:outer membrane protein assembly factor BamB
MVIIKERSLFAVVVVMCWLTPHLGAAADWPTFGRDPQRSGWAFDESTFTFENVSGLELKWKTQVKNQPRALSALTAPVVAGGVATPSGIKTVVYVAGTSNNIFALDAETGDVIWNLAFEIHISPKDRDIFQCYNGITATPTIDRKRNIIYVIAADGRLFGLDLGTGAIRFGPIQFVPPYAKTWSLNLVDDVVYTEISQGCGGAASGIYSMSIDDRLRPVIRNLLIAKTRDQGSGAWGRGGPVIGRNHRIYIATGDGEYDPLGGEFSNSVIAASLKDLAVTDYFTPHNWTYINKYDLDISCTHPVWFAYKGYNLLAVGGKEGVIYLMDADALGNKDHQTPLFTTPQLGNDEGTFEAKGIWGGLSAWTDEEGETWIYAPIWGPVSKHAPKFPGNSGPNPNGCIMAFKVIMGDSGNPVLQPAWISGDFGVPEPTIIANGIVFALSTGENPHQTHGGADIIYRGQPLLNITERGQNTTHAVLYALDARTGKVLYQSGSAMPTWVHFSGLALADGRVYAVDHESRVLCFGLAKKE